MATPFDFATSQSPPGDQPAGTLRNRRVGVLYLADRNYHSITEIAIASLLFHNALPISVHFFQVGYSQAVAAPISSFAEQNGHRIEIHKLSNQDLRFGDVQRRGAHTYVSEAALLKGSAIDALAADYDYLIYIDGDVVCFRELGLAHIGAFEQIMAAVPDFSVAAGYEKSTEAANSYFNSGVLLINCAVWRATSAFELYVERVVQHADHCDFMEDCGAHDQCALNMVADGDWARLPLTWNAQKIVSHTRLWRDAVLRHYTGPKKFLPITNWACDDREYKLLTRLEDQFGLPIKSRRPYDFGLAYWLNSLRRHGHVVRMQATIDRLEREALA